MSSDLMDPTALLPADLARDPHRRYNPLIDEWVLVSAGSDASAVARAPRSPRPPRIDRRTSPTATSARRTSARTATGTRPMAPRSSSTTTSRRFGRTRPRRPWSDGLLRAEGERGTCRVVCFSPRHDLTLGAMTPEAVAACHRRLGRADAPSLAPRTDGSRCSRTAARRWARRTRTRTARSGPGRALPVEARPGDREPGGAPRSDRSPVAPRLRRARSRAASGSSSRPTSGWSSCRSGRPGRSRRC